MAGDDRSPDQIVETILERAQRRPPTLGAGRLVCLDGLAGSGKTTLAARMAERCPDAVVLATDEMLHGWRGLPGLGLTLERLLAPLARGEIGAWRRWDWFADAWAEEHAVSPTALLVLEGVGSAAAEIDRWITLRVWVEASASVRHARWIDRDGPESEGYWATWAADEAEHHRRQHTRERADLVLDTGSGSGPAISPE